MAKTVPPPPNLPMMPLEAGSLVPPSAANPTIPRAHIARAPAPVSVPSPEERAVSSAAAVPSAPPPAVTAASTVSSESGLDLPELSPEAVVFMLSERYRQSEAGAARDFNLTPEDLSFLNEMDHLVLGGSLPLDGYVRAMRGEFPDMSSDRKDALIARLLAERFLPWRDALTPPASTVAQREKLVLPAVPYHAVYVKPLTFGGAAGEVAHMADIPLKGQGRERLRDIVMSRAKGIRVDAQAEEQLMRPLEFGGLGLEREMARRAILAMNDVLSRARLMSEEEYSAWLAAEARRQNPPQPSMPETRARVAPEEEEDRREIAAISASMPKPVRDTSSVLALSTQTLMDRLSLKPTDGYVRRRLENLISTRLRDVRSRHDILLTLMRDVKVGGVGLDRPDAERVAAQIEDGYGEFRNLIAQEEHERLASQSKEQERKIEERKKREAEEHAQWFREKVQGVRGDEAKKRDVLQRWRMASDALARPETPAHPMDAKEQVKEKRAYGTLVPVAPAARSVASFAAPPAQAAAPMRPSSGGSRRTPPAPATTSEHAPSFQPAGVGPSVKISEISARARETQAGMLRPSMEDVRALQPRLSGPLQELQMLALSTFRRLGKTPADAAMQIERKIELLGQESFERRVEGIRAWQSSPLQQAYLGLIAEAFSKSVPVNTLVTQKREACVDVLTQEELTAVVALNGRLHF